MIWGTHVFLLNLQSMNSRVRLLVGVNSCLLEWPSCRGHDAVMPRRPPSKWSHPFIHLPTLILRCWKSLTLWAFVSSGMESVVHRTGINFTRWQYGYVGCSFWLHQSGCEMSNLTFHPGCNELPWFLYSYGHLSVISTKKTPFIECIITSYNWYPLVN